MKKTPKLILQSLVVLFLVILINGFVSRSGYQYDFTKEKRFTLTQSSKQVLSSLDEDVNIYVFLEGNNLSTDFKRLQTATKDLLQQYKKVSRGKIRIQFEDPLKGLTKEEKKQTLIDLQRRGITPRNIRIKTKTGYSENLIFPGALIDYKGKQFPVMLLSGQRGRDAVNRSIELLEYKFGNAISKLQLEQTPMVVFAQGNDELSPLETRDLRESLAQNFYRTADIDLTKVDSIPSSINLLVIAKPEKPFTKTEKFKIDQFVMNGGKTLWAIDMMKMNLDSLKMRWGGKNVAVDFNLNLDDQLFKYGTRINRNLVRDLQSKPTPVVIDESGQTKLFPWTFFPIISGKEEHLITKNISPIGFDFVSSIDTIGTPNVKKTVLLTSSENAGLVANPVLVDLQELRNPPPPSAFPLKNIPVAVLLEGKFRSLFKHRSTPVENWQATRKDQSILTKMVVLSDGDVLRNEISPKGQVFPLGFDRSLGEQFGNKEFLLNVIDYLVSDNNVLEARNKQVELRLLNQTKVEAEKGKWQLIAFVIPLSFILLVSLLFYFIRKSRFNVVN